MSFNPTDKVSPWPVRSFNSETGFQRFESLIDVKKLKDEYLFGIPLKSALTNTEITDDTLKSFITRAVSTVEMECRIAISPVEFKEQFTYYLSDYKSYNFLQLSNWPVIRATGFWATYPNTVTQVQYPTEWIAMKNEIGQFQIAPTVGSLAQIYLSNQGSYLPTVLGGRQEWPNLWTVQYLAGFELDKIPAAVNDLIACQAAMKALQVLAPVIFPINSYGIGIDGTSQSVATMGPQFLQGRIQDLKETILQLTKIIKDRFNQSIICGMV